MKSFQRTVFFRWGAGAVPWRRRMLPTVWSHLVTQIRQGSHDAVVAPARVLLRHAHDQTLNVRTHAWGPGTASRLGAVELVGDEPAIPRQNGFGLRHHRHFPQSLSPESVGNLGQGGLFTVGKQQTALDLRFENAVLGGQILVPQPEFLIDRFCDVGEHACPNHLVASPPIAKDRSSRVAGEPRDYHAG